MKKATALAGLLLLVASAAEAVDKTVELKTSLGQSNADVSQAVVKFGCPIAAGPVAWIVNPVDNTMSVTVGPVNFNKGNVTVTLHSPNAPFEFVAFDVTVRVVCAAAE